MTINTVYIPNGATRYYIKNAGGGDVCYFESLETAGIVLRYLLGGDMPLADCDFAAEAMRGFDQLMTEQAAQRAAERAERRRQFIERRAQEGGTHANPE